MNTRRGSAVIMCLADLGHRTTSQSQQQTLHKLSSTRSETAHLCEHTSHPACLVSMEHAGGWGPHSEGKREHTSGLAKVSWPVCHAVGVVPLKTKNQVPLRAQHETTSSNVMDLQPHCYCQRKVERTAVRV